MKASNEVKNLLDQHSINWYETDRKLWIKQVSCFKGKAYHLWVCVENWSLDKLMSWIGY